MNSLISTRETSANISSLAIAELTGKTFSTCVRDVQVHLDH